MSDQTLGEAVANWRAAEAALRQIAKNGGRTRATSRAILRHDSIIGAAQTALMAAGQRELVGILIDEAELAERLACNPDRPEIAARLSIARMDIRRFVQLLGDRALEPNLT